MLPDNLSLLLPYYNRQNAFSQSTENQWVEYPSRDHAERLQVLYPHYWPAGFFPWPAAIYLPWTKPNQQFAAVQLEETQTQDLVSLLWAIRVSSSSWYINGTAYICSLPASVRQNSPYIVAVDRRGILQEIVILYLNCSCAISWCLVKDRNIRNPH